MKGHLNFLVLFFVYASTAWADVFAHEFSRMLAEAPLAGEGATGHLFSGERIREYSGHSAWKKPSHALLNNSKVEPHDRWVVITTINSPTTTIKQMAALKDWAFVLVGDLSTPEPTELMSHDKFVFLSPQDQEELGYDILRFIPWRHFGRKNIGYLFAIEHGAKVTWFRTLINTPVRLSPTLLQEIYDTDDDNILLTDELPTEAALKMNCTTVPAQPLPGMTDPTSAQVYNPYLPYSHYLSWPRGYPLRHIRKHGVRLAPSAPCPNADIGVYQFLADRDPDVDAIYRLTRHLPLNFAQGPTLVYPQHVFAPYNAQATLFKQSAFWSLLLPVTVHGRVSDIWRSYIAQPVLWGTGSHLAFTSPKVYQDRNVHDYIKDFVAEDHLYKRTDALLKLLQEIAKEHVDIDAAHAIEICYVALYERGFLEITDVYLLQAWLLDLKRVGYTFPKIGQ